MNYRNSSYTGRAARTLYGAFGPHTSTKIYEPREPLTRAQIAVYAMSAIGAVCVIVFQLIGWIK